MKKYIILKGEISELKPLFDRGILARWEVTTRQERPKGEARTPEEIEKSQAFKARIEENLNLTDGAGRKRSMRCMVEELCLYFDVEAALQQGEKPMKIYRRLAKSGMFAGRPVQSLINQYNRLKNGAIKRAATEAILIEHALKFR